MSNILALDFGMKLGWALSQSKEITGGTLNLHTRPPVKASYRWTRFKNWLSGIHQRSGGLDIICYEDVFRHSSQIHPMSMVLSGDLQMNFVDKKEITQALTVSAGRELEDDDE